MQTVAALVAVAVPLCLGAASPGPSFLMVARTAAARGRAHALRAAMGMGVGGLVFALAALIGLNAVFKAVPTLYLASKALGGAYLCYLGLRLWRSASRPLGWGPADMLSERSRSAFLLGFATQISNPKTAVVYASVFAAFMPAAPTLLFDMALVTMVFFIETGWYALVATTLAAQAPRTVYLRLKTWIDRCAGGILCALGLGLVRSAIQR